jgi:glyoxylase-like metal-dependent hydrolase (beta-lactamase superfamily II)
MTDAFRPIAYYESAEGAQIARIPLLAFPGLWGYAFLVVVDDPQLGPMRVLIDAGSGFGDCNTHLDEGLKAAAEEFDLPGSYESLTHILVTHGHIDHIGGLNHVRKHSHAPLYIHELDRRVLTSFSERVTVIARRLAEFLVEAGVSEPRRSQILDMYLFVKRLFKPEPVDFTYEAIGMRLGPFEMLHVPGHSAGHVAIRIHDILFSGDLILSDITPHQAPEHLTLSTGLDHYLQSLDHLLEWAPDVTLTLGGHRQAVKDLPGRVAEIKAVHQERLQQTLDILRTPHTILEASKILFKEVHGYNVLLALEETGAHVEYLYQRGKLAIVNLDNIEHVSDGISLGPVPLVYQCMECKIN